MREALFLHPLLLGRLSHVSVHLRKRFVFFRHFLILERDLLAVKTEPRLIQRRILFVSFLHLEMLGLFLPRFLGCFLI